MPGAVGKAHDSFRLVQRSQVVGGKKVKDRVFVSSILDAFGYSFATARERRDTFNDIPEWPGPLESLLQALLKTTGTLGGLLDPPQIVEIGISNRWGRWTIIADGPIWKVTPKPEKRESGRPRRTVLDVRKIREAYKERQAAAILLRKELRQCYKSLNGTKKRRWQTSRTAGENCLPRCKLEWLSHHVAASGRDEAAALIWEGKKSPEIIWNDFLAGRFAPRDLALLRTGVLLSRAPATVANIMKPKKKVRK